MIQIGNTVVDAENFHSIDLDKMHLKAFQKSMKQVIISNDDLQSDCESVRFDISKVYPLKNIK